MKIRGKTSDNPVCFYLSEQHVLAEVVVLHDTDLTEHGIFKCG